MRGSAIAATVIVGLGFVTSFKTLAAESWVNLAASANGDYRSALDTDSFEQYGTNSWAVWIRLEYTTSRKDSLFSPSYKTDLRRYLVRCGERTMATIQRTSLDDEGAPVRQERWPESKWEFNAVGPSGGTNATESGTSVALAWTDQSSDETGFKVEYKTSARGTWTTATATAANATSYTVSSFSAGTYWFRVVATNINGDAMRSSEVQGVMQ